MVLGIEQDVVGVRPDPTEGFAGHAAGFRVWNQGGSMYYLWLSGLPLLIVKPSITVS